MSEPCKNCGRETCPMLKDFDFAEDRDSALEDCNGHLVMTLTARALAAEAEALSLRVAAAANLEKLRALKREHLSDCIWHSNSEWCNCGFCTAHNAAIDAAIRVLGGE